MYRYKPYSQFTVGANHIGVYKWGVYGRCNETTPWEYIRGFETLFFARRYAKKILKTRKIYE